MIEKKQLLLDCQFRKRKLEELEPLGPLLGERERERKKKRELMIEFGVSINGSLNLLSTL